jgi:transketolase
MKNSFPKKALKIPLDKRSKIIRKSIIKGIVDSGRGHFGSAMSTVEILRVLYDDFMKYDPKNPKKEKRDRLILSKGHGCLSLYSILADKGFFSKKYLGKVGHPNSILGGHPEYLKVPGIEASTGALGHGLSIASGMALSLKIKKSKSKVFVILGDGEINEGSNWEAAMSASKHQLTNLKVFIDYNKIQSYGFTKDVVDLEPLTLKWKSFGFEVSEVNGHNVKELRSNIKKFYKKKDKKPSITICHTIKGKGFSFAENNPFWHHKNSFTQEDIKKFDESLAE